MLHLKQVTTHHVQLSLPPPTPWQPMSHFAPPLSESRSIFKCEVQLARCKCNDSSGLPADSTRVRNHAYSVAPAALVSSPSCAERSGGRSVVAKLHALLVLVAPREFTLHARTLGDARRVKGECTRHTNSPCTLTPVATRAPHEGEFTLHTNSPSTLTTRPLASRRRGRGWRVGCASCKPGSALTRSDASSDDSSARVWGARDVPAAPRPPNATRATQRVAAPRCTGVAGAAGPSSVHLRVDREPALSATHRQSDCTGAHGGHSVRRALRPAAGAAWPAHASGTR